MLNKITLFFKRNYVPVLLVILSCIVYNRFLFNKDLLVFDDFRFRYDNSLKEYPLYPRSWLMNTNLGIPYIQKFMYPLDLIAGLLARSGLSWSIIQRVLYFWPLIFLGPLISFLLFKKILGSDIGAGVGSIVYTYNSYFMVALYFGFFGVFLSQIFAPLFILLLIKSIEKKKLYHSLIAGMSGLLITMYDFRTFYVIGMMSVIFAISYLFTHAEKGRIKKILLDNLIYFTTPFLITLALNSYWLLDFFTSHGDYSIALDRGLWSVWGHSLINSLSLFHPRYERVSSLLGYTAQHIFGMRLYSWTITMLAFCGLMKYRRNKRIVLIVLISLIFIFLSKQEGSPFPEVYQFLYLNFPGFNAFREAGKFYFVIALGYGLLLGSFIKHIWKNGKSVSKQYVKVFVIVIFSFVTFLNLRHLIEGVDPIFKAKEIPRDYQIFNNFIGEQTDYFSVLWLPYASKHWADEYTDDRPSLGLISLIRDWHWRDFVSHNYKNGLFARRDEVVTILQRQYSDRLLDASSVKYVAIQLYDPELTESFIDLALMHGERVYFYNTLKKLPYLEEINIGTDEVAVFENKNFKPLFYTTKEILSIYRDTPYEEVSYHIKNSSRFGINIKNVKDPFYFNFSQSFHPGWKIRVGEFSWFKSLLHKDYFESRVLHIENDAKLSSYYVDPEEICAYSNCTRNQRGGYDLNLTLYFVPQSYMNFGLFITLLSFGGILIYCVIYFIRCLKKGKIYE